MDQLSADDVAWLQQLPFTLTFPRQQLIGTLLISVVSFYVYVCYACKARPSPVLLAVHAGLVPGVPLEKQDFKAMTTMRNLAPQPWIVQLLDTLFGTQTPLKPLETTQAGTAWAFSWQGDKVVFGHDAMRRLQRTRHAVGIDGGCVYGHDLLGYLYPSEEIISVSGWNSKP